MILPPDAVLYDRETIWNLSEKLGMRSNSQLAHEIELALPIELTLEEQVELLREFVMENFISLNMAADISIHYAGERNHHAHIMIPTRIIDNNGFGKINREFNDYKNLELWRKGWAEIQNREFENKGFDVRVSHESYMVQDFDKSVKREPTEKLGKKATALERRGIKTDRGNENRKIIERNNKKLERNELKRDKSRTYER